MCSQATKDLSKTDSPSCQNLCRIAESVPCWKGTLDFSYQTEKNSEQLKVQLESIESESIWEWFKGLDVIRCWVRSRSVQHKWLGYLWVPGVSMSGGGCMACMKPQHLMWHWPSLRFATLFCKKQTNEEWMKAYENIWKHMKTMKIHKYFFILFWQLAVACRKEATHQ